MKSQTVVPDMCCHSGDVQIPSNAQLADHPHPHPPHQAKALLNIEMTAHGVPLTQIQLAHAIDNEVQDGKVAFLSSVSIERFEREMS